MAPGEAEQMLPDARNEDTLLGGKGGEALEGLQLLCGRVRRGRIVCVHFLDLELFVVVVSHYV